MTLKYPINFVRRTAWVGMTLIGMLQACAEESAQYDTASPELDRDGAPVSDAANRGEGLEGKKATRELYHYSSTMKRRCNYLDPKDRHDPAATDVKKVEQEVLIAEIRNRKNRSCESMEKYAKELLGRTKAAAYESYKRIAAAVSCVRAPGELDEVHLLKCIDHKDHSLKKTFTIDFYALN